MMFRWHWQDLNESKKPYTLHGRGWLQLAERFTVEVEWNAPSSRCAVAFGVSDDDDDAIKASIGVPPLSLYFAIDSWMMSRWVRRLIHKGSDEWGSIGSQVGGRAAHGES